MNRSNHDRPSSSYGYGRNSDRGDDTTDVLVPFASSISQSRSVQGGNESSDSRKWFASAFFKTSSSNQTQTYKVHEIEAGPVTVCAAEDNFYNMNHQQRGKCIIFNHTVFDKKQGLSKREGSHSDVESIKATFSRFGFSLVIHEDLKYGEIIRYIEAIANEDHSQSDCLVIFVLTHGQSDQLHAYDVTYKPSLLWNSLTADKCSSLAGKPKMFFIQACRGELYDNGTELKRKVPRTQVDGPSKFENSYRIPNQADFLTVFSTVEAAKENVDFLRFTMQYLSLGFFSWRNSRNGSCFIQTICRVFEDNFKTKDVLSMLTLVNRSVAIVYESRSRDPAQNMKKQTPHVCHTLMREIFLKPKIQSTLV